MTENLKISTVIPVYNAEAYLSRCLDSILTQNLNEIEVICVDDCSEDHSLSILRDYARNDSRVTVIANEVNMNAGESRNRGLKSARGEFVHFMDADDYIAPEAYEKLYSKAKENNLDLLKAKAYEVDDRTGIITHNPWYSYDSLDARDYDSVTNFYEIPNKFLRVAVAPWSGIYRRLFLIENDICFNHLKCVNDRSFYNKVIINAQSVMFIDYFFLYHRTNIPGSLVANRAINFECHFDSYDIIKRQSANIPEEARFLIMESEIQDMFAWYKKYLRKDVLMDQIFTKTKIFLNDLDVSVFGNKLEQCRWYEDYLKIIRSKEALSPKTKDRNSLLKRVLQLCRENGFRYTVRLAVRKIQNRLIRR